MPIRDQRQEQITGTTKSKTLYVLLNFQIHFNQGQVKDNKLKVQLFDENDLKNPAKTFDIKMDEKVVLSRYRDESYLVEEKKMFKKWITFGKIDRNVENDRDPHKEKKKQCNDCEVCSF